MAMSAVGVAGTGRGPPRFPAGDSRVLVVDDEPEIVSELVEHLTDEGLKCAFAFNAREAMDLIVDSPDIGVVVTDIRMPGIDGLEMAKRLHAELEPERDVAVIVVTGHAGMKEAIEAIKVGAEDFLTKPVSPDHLLHAVRRAGELVHLRRLDREFKKHLAREVKAKTAESRALSEELAGKNRELIDRNEDLLAASCAKDEFLTMISHEFRTPLNAILGFAQVMEKRLTDGDESELRGFLSHIFSGGQRLHALLEAVLNFVDLNTGRAVLRHSPCRVPDLFDAVVASFESKLDAANQAIRVDKDVPTDEVTWDQRRMISVLGYLVDNGIKFSPPGDTLRLSARKVGDRMQVSVSDQGSGMSEEEIIIALQPLRQIDVGLARKAEGLGLGLSLARLYVELHGGNLDIESTPGEGTTVTMTLPVRDPNSETE
jgi:signal transduction histidine kinase